MCPAKELPIGMKKIERVFSENNEYSTSDQLFNNIVGYNDVKKLFRMSFSAEKPVHILLVGPPASAKTLFMLDCIKLERSFFTLGSHSTKSGMIDYLFKQRPRYLIVDEIEHMPMKDQTALLSLMETGIIAETKYQKTRNTQMKTWVFATSNGTERMLTPLLSRFIVLHFKQYRYENFRDIAVHILAQEGVSSEIASASADAVWRKMRSKDIRDCMKIGRLAKIKEDVDWIADTLKTYK
ncbi:MAG TPA: ATP-binding protein [Nitrososphaeraceae archaeon]|jgi:Holliday junction resolvasome RuvABC ATP-dependent DNA helicase subunit|nr:ATP-binding protein [Nitrososphaeraceae archaeon]